MKKIFFSLVALAALAACSKSEIAYEQTGEIVLSPVTSNTTKSVAGYNSNTFDGIFPTAIDLYVFANAQDENAQGELLSSWTSPYFKNAPFVHSSKGNEGTQTHPTLEPVATAGAYAGEPTRYWPNVKTLKFVGYSDACNVSTLTKAPYVNTDLSTLTIEGYVQDNDNTAEGANDLMWFPVTSAYGKSEGEIPAQMKHACSWITINVAGDDVTATYEEGDPAVTHTGWTLNSLVVKTLKHSGKVVCNATTAQWTLSGEDEYEEYYKPTTGTTFTKQYVKYENATNNFIVLPQTPTSLDVTYTFTSQEAVGTNPAITLTETKNVPLTFNGSDPWLPGVHYIYNVKITATEILIDPVVVEWTESVYDADKDKEGNQPIEI